MFDKIADCCFYLAVDCNKDYCLDNSLNKSLKLDLGLGLGCGLNLNLNLGNYCCASLTLTVDLLVGC